MELKEGSYYRYNNDLIVRLVHVIADVGEIKLCLVDDILDLEYRPFVVDQDDLAELTKEELLIYGI